MSSRHTDEGTKVFVFQILIYRWVDRLNFKQLFLRARTTRSLYRLCDLSLSLDKERSKENEVRGKPLTTRAASRGACFATHLFAPSGGNLRFPRRRSKVLFRQDFPILRSVTSRWVESRARFCSAGEWDVGPASCGSYCMDRGSVAQALAHVFI